MADTCRILQGTDDAGRTPASDAARLTFRAAIARIPSAVSEQRALELREAALAAYRVAVGRKS
jgi:hypothetical protein